MEMDPRTRRTLETVDVDPTGGTMGYMGVGTPRISCPELFFQPHLNSLELPGLHELVYRAVSHGQSRTCQVPYGGGLPQTDIILSGGSTMFPNMAERLQFELGQLRAAPTKVIAAPERMINTWIGGKHG